MGFLPEAQITSAVFIFGSSSASAESEEQKQNRYRHPQEPQQNPSHFAFLAFALKGFDYMIDFHFLVSFCS